MQLTQTDAFAAGRYDSRTILLHWATALLVVLAWGMAQIIDDFPRGPLRVDARSVHMVFGAALAIVLIFRVAHRAGSGVALPRVGPVPLHVLAKAVHYALYALLIAQVLLGFTLAYVRGDSVFNLFALPGAGGKSLRDTIGDIHGTVANVILILAGVHAAAALVHHYVWHDGVLRRMMPGRTAPITLRD